MICVQTRLVDGVFAVGRGTTIAAVVAVDGGRLPTLGCARGAVDVDKHRMTDGLVRGVGRRIDVARTGRHHAQQVDLGGQLQIVTSADRRGLHEMLPGVAGCACT